MAAAVDRQAPLDDDVTLSLAGPVDSVREMARLVPQVLAAVQEPFVLVLDDVHHLAGTPTADLIAGIHRTLPPGAELALSGRTRPEVPLGRLRVEGQVREIGPDDLALSRSEARALLRTRGLAVDDSGLDELYQATEGWLPACS
jgi:LuxR family maltose regulon positive regulatory protein